MAQYVLILYTPVIEYMKGWEGDVGRSVRSLTRRIELFQKLYAPKKTGALWRSITTGVLGHGATGIQTLVGSNPDQRGRRGYGYWQDQGTRAHMIRPKASNKTGFMVFFWPRVGHVVYRRAVHHPGNPATHWATRGMESGVAAWS